MKDDNIEEQYKEWASSYEDDKLKIFEKSGLNYEDFMNYFIDLCDLKPDIRILDVGAGTGLTSLALAKEMSYNFGIIALEPVDEMIAIAKNNIDKQGFQKHISIKKGNGENIPYDNNSFDLVVSTFAIRHMSIEKALKEFKRVIKNNGRIVIADICAPDKWRTILGKFIRFIFQKIIRRKYKGEDKSKVLTMNEWNELLENLGLKGKEVLEFSGKRDPNWELKRVILSIEKVRE